MDEFDVVGEFHIFNNKAEEIFPPQTHHISLPVQNSGIKEALIDKQFSNKKYYLDSHRKKSDR